LRMNKMFIQTPKFTRKVATGTIWILLNHLALIACFIFYEKRVETKEKVPNKYTRLP